MIVEELPELIDTSQSKHKSYSKYKKYGRIKIIEDYLIDKIGNIPV